MYIQTCICTSVSRIHTHIFMWLVKDVNMYVNTLHSRRLQCLFDWQSQFTNTREIFLLEAFRALNPVLLNERTLLTFSKNSLGSIMDLSFALPQLERSMRWQVSDLYTASDHMAILFMLQTQEQSNLEKTTNPF